ncbi:MAG: diacylglycerol kinase family protein [Coriobacteriia bacterium]|nr:diacylglycerol kinase family protein [Coriobacteriia bacterium]
MMPPKKHPSLQKSFYYAFEGLKTAFVMERNFKVMLVFALLAIIAAFILKLSALAWALLLIVIGMVLSAELLNTAIETTVDLVSPEYHELAKRAKDIAAAGVVIFAFISVIVGLIIFIDAFLQ